MKHRAWQRALLPISTAPTGPKQLPALAAEVPSEET